MQTPTISVNKARLLAAAAIIRERGHGKKGGKGPPCIMQALAIADGLDPKNWYTVDVPEQLLVAINRRAKDWFEAGFCIPSNSVAAYNDYCCDGGQDAIDTLLEAAELS